MTPVSSVGARVGAQSGRALSHRLLNRQSLVSRRDCRAEPDDVELFDIILSFRCSTRPRLLEPWRASTGRGWQGQLRPLRKSAAAVEATAHADVSVVVCTTTR